MDRFATMAATIPFRVPFILAGLAGLVLAAMVILQVLRRARGRGRPFDVEAVAGRMYNGDIDAAAANVRTKFQYALIFAVWSILLILVGALGERFLELQISLFGGAVLATVALWLWAWVERQYGRPGWLVPVEVQGTPGLRHVPQRNKLV